jgi:hypothetical protein
MAEDPAWNDDGVPSMFPGDVPDVIGLLWETLEQLEGIEGISPDDPALVEL